MRITLIGVLAVIGTVVLLALIADRLIRYSNANQSGNHEQPINPS